MARITNDTTTPAPTQLGLRAELHRIGRRWSVSLTHLIQLSARLDTSGEWALDGSPTCAHWLAAVLDVELCTARDWLRIGRALDTLPQTSTAFADGTVSFTKVRALTRVATVDNEAELLDLADRTPASRLGAELAAWSARNEDEEQRRRRHRRDRSMSWRTEPDGMVTCSIRVTPRTGGNRDGCGGCAGDAFRWS